MRAIKDRNEKNMNIIICDDRIDDRKKSVRFAVRLYEKKL